MTLGQGAIAFAAEPTDYSGEIQCQTHTGGLSKPTGTETKQKMGIWEREQKRTALEGGEAWESWARTTRIYYAHV